MPTPSKLLSLPRMTQEALAAEILTGQRTKADVARFYKTTDTSVRRFLEKFTEEDKLRLVSREMEKSRLREAEAQANAVTLFGEDVKADMKWLLSELRQLLENAKDDDDRYMALGSLKEIRQALMSLAEVQGQLSKKIEVTMDMRNSPAFLDLKTVVLRVLERHPEAKADFLAEMQGMKLIEPRLG